MNKTELLEIIDKGEDYYCEFKEQAAHPDDLAAEIVGFANSDGGKLLMGISDDGNAVGVTDADKEIGTGIIRVIRLLKEHTGKEPDFEERGQDFVARIWRNQD